MAGHSSLDNRRGSSLAELAAAVRETATSNWDGFDHRMIPRCWQHDRAHPGEPGSCQHIAVLVFGTLETPCDREHTNVESGATLISCRDGHPLWHHTLYEKQS